MSDYDWAIAEAIQMVARAILLMWCAVLFPAA